MSRLLLGRFEGKGEGMLIPEGVGHMHVFIFWGL